jgi:ribonuclease VapC
VILDASAIVAVVQREPGYEALLDKLAAADLIGIGAPTAAETVLVLTARLGPAGRDILHRLLDEWQVEVIPFGADHWREAADAYARFGRGRHRAALTFGDCLSYAVAKLSGQPLLATGSDFTRTDLELA